MSDTTRARWERMQALADAALDMDAGEVGAFLDRECAGDPDLRAEVADLLRWCDRAGDFLEEPAAHLAGPLLALDHELAEGRVVGAYRIIAEAGRGGMGTVYLAERADAEFRQQVALKIVRNGLTGLDAVRRFRDERQILASMNHPAIARLFDGGVAADGSPYFVMEFVEGRPIDRYCDETGLGIDERLALFLRVCDAVQYAHNKLVVHRDIKPSNILITADGQVKLLDFGIAKVLATDASEEPPLATRTGVRPMTPEYASPEQVAGETVSTSTDIYSLGVLLYRLLTGRLPFARGGLPGDLERSILERSPERPSTVVLQHVGPDRQREARVGAAPPERLSRRLRGDLDTIVLRALQKEPERRYSTAAHFADDVRRHLAGLPVTARPDSWSYRARRFVGRHRVGTAAAAAFSLLLMGATTVTAVQAARIRSQSAALMIERDRASAVSDFLLDVFRASDPNEAQGDEVSALELLDRAAQRIDSELAVQPETRATMQRVMAKAYHNLAHYDRAEPLYRAALETYANTDAGTRAGLLVDLGNLAHDRGRLDDAEVHFAEALALLRTAPNVPPEVLGNALDNLGMVYHRRRDLERAEAFYREGLALRERIVPPDSDALASSLSNIASVLQDRGEYAAADSLFRQAIAIHRSVLGNTHPLLSATLNNHGMLLVARGNLDEAKTVMEEALSIRTRVFGDAHPLTLITMNNLAAILERDGDLDRAEQIYRLALERKIEAVGEVHPSVATGLNNLGLVVMNRGALDDADALMRRSLDVRREVYGERNPPVAAAIHNLAALQERRGDTTRALALYREALDMRRETLGSENPLSASTALAIGLLLLQRHDAAGAEPLLREAADVRRDVYDVGDARTAQAEAALGAALSELGRYEEADALLRSAYQALRTARGDDDSGTARARAWLDQHERRTGGSLVAGRR